MNFDHLFNEMFYMMFHIITVDTIILDCTCNENLTWWFYSYRNQESNPFSKSCNCWHCSRRRTYRQTYVKSWSCLSQIQGKLLYINVLFTETWWIFLLWKTMFYYRIPGFWFGTELKNLKSLQEKIDRIVSIIGKTKQLAQSTWCCYEPRWTSPWWW